MTPTESATAQRPLSALQFSVRLPATRHGAHRARQLAVEHLRAWGLPYEDAAHVVAELAANAALHGHVPGRGFRLGLAVGEVGGEPRVLRIEVTDPRPERLPAAPRPAPPEVSASAESGRGLLLVEALATRWGATAGPSPAKTVWAELAL